MTGERKFRDIDTAPTDGTTVEVRHGPFQTPTLAYWSQRGQGWIADGDPARRHLSQVTGWRPVAPDAPKRRKR